MTNRKTTKRAIIASVMAMILCFAMFVGTTYAWFTDSVTSTGNKVVAGTLKVDLELKSHDDNSYNSIKDTQAPIFYYDNWEPGYIDSQILKIENEGSLALKWYAKFVSDYELSALANVIDVYVYESATDFAFPGRDLTGYTKVGTVKEFVNTIEDTTNGTLAPNSTKYTELKHTDYTGMPSEMYLGIALKMQEEAGNEYQGMSLCGDFDILILATQETAEIDTIDNQYDAGAEFDEFEVRNVSTEAQLAEVVSSTTKEAPVVVNLKENVTLNGNINVVGDVTINLADNNMDATLNAKRPFVMTEGSSLTINNMANEDDIVVGKYGLVDVPENVTDVDITLNGGSYVANTVNGSFLKIRSGYDKVDVTLKGVDYVDSSNDGYILNMATTTAYQGDYTITIEDCNFESTYGITTNNGKENTLISITNTTIKTKAAAIIVHGAKANITDCTITVDTGIMDGTAPAAYVAVSGNGVAKVSNCTMSGPVVAFDVYTSGGEIYVTDCDWTGATADYSLDDSASATSKIVIDGTEYNG